MGFLFAGLLAAAVSWAGNRVALRIMGTDGIAVLAPMIEELAKTGTAVLTGSPVILTHAVFGLVEGVYDAWDAGWPGFRAGLVSFGGHLFYGYVTSLVLQKHKLVLLAIVTGYLMHMLWNVAVLKFVVRKRRGSG